MSMYAPKQAYDKHIFPPDGGLGERGGIGAPEGGNRGARGEAAVWGRGAKFLLKFEIRFILLT